MAGGIGMREIKRGDIVQVIDPESNWFPCLVIVEELKSFGIQGYTTVPIQGDAYIRLNRGQYEFVGIAAVRHEESE